MQKKFFRLSSSLLALVLAMTLVLVACSTPANGVTSLALTDMTFELADASDIQVHSFHLGNGELTNSAGNPVPAPLAGIIAVPDHTGPHPLVVIIHGVRAVESIHDSVYEGFDYLVQQLAAEGFAAMSINVNVEYTFDFGESSNHEWVLSIFEQHLALLERATAGEDVGHGIDLTAMIDVEQVHLIGHSRGGEIIDSIAQQDEQGRIRSMISVAGGIGPFFFEFDEDDEDGELSIIGTSPPNIPTAFILSEFEGDFQIPFSQVVFDEILAQAQSHAMSNLVYLRGANHNHFNRTVERDDRTLDTMIGNVAQTVPETWITREEQEDFLTHYVAAFLAVVTEVRAPFGTFDPLTPQPTTMFGYSVTASTYLPGLELIVPPGNGTATGAATAEGYTQYGFGFRSLFNHPAVNNRQHPELELTALTWDGSDGEVAFNPQTNDFSAHGALSLYVAVDTSNGLNPDGADQAFSVILTDEAGVEQGVVVPAGSSALTFHPGFVSEFELFDEMATEWQGFMPLGELRIPLSYFGELDLQVIDSITIAFDQTPSGAVMLSGIYLV